MSPKQVTKHTVYDLVAYYDNLINSDNPELVVTRMEFPDETAALTEGKRLAVEGVHMFEIFAKVTYEEGGRQVSNRVNTTRWVNFNPKNNAFIT